MIARREFDVEGMCWSESTELEDRRRRAAAVMFGSSDLPLEDNALPRCAGTEDVNAIGSLARKMASRSRWHIEALAAVQIRSDAQEQQQRVLLSAHERGTGGLRYRRCGKGTPGSSCRAEGSNWRMRCGDDHAFGSGCAGG